MTAERERPTVGVVELFRVFFVIGLTAFGVAVLQSLRTVPVKRGWLRREEIDEGLGLVQLYPGAIMMDLVAFIGYRAGRIRGALAAAAGFFTPALVLVLGLSWAYVEYGASGGVKDLVVGLDAIVVGVVASVAWDFAGEHLSGKLAIFLALAAFGVGIAGVNLLWAVLGALIAGALFLRPEPNSEIEIPSDVAHICGRRLALALVPLVVVAAAAIAAALTPGALGALVADMAKIGTIAFGNGYTILPVLQQDVVTTHHWLTISAFGAGIAFGQMTPGPIMITAVFVGFVVAGWWGGLLAGVAIFAPSVAITVVVAEIYPFLRRFAAVPGAITGILAAFVGLLATVVLTLGRQVVGVPAGVVLAVCAFTTVRLWKWNLLLVIGGGLAVWAVYVGLGGPIHV
jgi:chromate transporter